MGKVKRIWEQRVKAGAINPDETRGPGDPDAFGYPGDEIINQGAEPRVTIPDKLDVTDVPF